MKIFKSTPKVEYSVTCGYCREVKTIKIKQSCNVEQWLKDNWFCTGCGKSKFNEIVINNNINDDKKELNALIRILEEAQKQKKG